MSEMREIPIPTAIWGANHIDAETVKQIQNASLLPIAVASALMPDAHVGYGLPIGGVLATQGSVIPYAVGVDIACRMHLTIFQSKPIILMQKPDAFKKALLEHTLFGAGKEWQSKQRPMHEVLDDSAWKSTWLLRKLVDKAYAQLGTSGSGNHFVEWGTFELAEDDADLDLKAGQYLALLSHSGSRGVGYAIAEHYSEVARQTHPNLDARIAHLAWLDLRSGAGEEYWLSMTLAGQFASACHEVIHHRLAKAMGLKVAVKIDNHHNFAWKEHIQGQDLVVHRKGATPANLGELGIIPGSMGDYGYVVRGKGNVESLNSASHGAGRLLSRKQALEQVTKPMLKDYLKKMGVTLLGGDIDESPQVYKPIDQVMEAQTDLVTVLGKFMPRMVRMDGRLT